MGAAQSRGRGDERVKERRDLALKQRREASVEHFFVLLWALCRATVEKRCVRQKNLFMCRNLFNYVVHVKR